MASLEACALEVNFSSMPPWLAAHRRILSTKVKLSNVLVLCCTIF